MKFYSPSRILTFSHELIQLIMNSMDISDNQRQSIPNCVKLTTTGFRVPLARCYHSHKLLVI